MGWSGGYTMLEAQVVGLYDVGALTKEVLSVVVNPYRGTDIDSGGSRDLKSKDGKGVVEIVCFVMEPEKLAEIDEKVALFSPETVSDFSLYSDADDYRSSLLYELWHEITRREWGFW